MTLEEYKKIVAKYTAYNAEQLEKYVSETYLNGYGYLPFIKCKKIVDIRRMSEVSKTDGEKYFKSLVSLGNGMNSTEYYKLLNKLRGEYLSYLSNSKRNTNDRHQETQGKCRTEKLHSKRERRNDVEPCQNGPHYRYDPPRC